MSPNVPAPLAVVVGVIDILEELGIRYHLGGSFASAIHGVPRQTMDADLVVDLDADRVGPLVARLKDDFYVDSEVAADAVSRRGSFNAIHLESGFKVDFFIKGDNAFDEAELNRSELCQILDEPPRSAYVKSAEDTILRKLQWFRDGGEVSDRQWRDVLGILLAVGDDLDLEHLKEWAAELGLEPWLRRAWNEINER
jgi:hypothetical protein